MSSLPSTTESSCPRPPAESETAQTAAAPRVTTFSSILSRAAHESSLDDLAARLLQTVPAEGVAIALEYGDGYICRAAQGNAPQVGTEIEPGVGFCGACVQQGRTVVEQEIEGELRSLVAIPIHREAKRVAGCVATFSSCTHAFSETEIQKIAAVASYLGQVEWPSFAEVEQEWSSTAVENPIVEPVATVQVPVTSVPTESDLDLKSEIIVQSEASERQPDLTGVDALVESLVTYSTEEPHKSRVVPVLIIVVLLGILLAAIVSYRKEPPAHLAQAGKTGPAASKANAVPPPGNDEPAYAKLPTSPSSAVKHVQSPPAMVVDDTVIIRRMTAEVEDVQPPKVLVQSPATIQPQIPVLPSTTIPTLAETQSSYQEPRLIHRVNPKYPEEARKMKVAGNVELLLTVSPQGSVGRVQVISGSELLVASALNAVRQWKYEPAKIGDKAVQSSVKLTIKFAADAQ